MSSLKDQKVLLTGASSGIGAALAKELCKRGAIVFAAARRADKLQALVDELGADKCKAVALDVTDHEACAAAVAALDDKEGGIDVVIANAGVGGRAINVFKIDVGDAKQVIDTNLMGSLAVILPLLPRMKQRSRGHVVGISSLAADLAIPAAPVYGTSKAAFTFFLDSVAPDLLKAGIVTTIVHPGFVKSEMTAKNKFKMPFLVETDDAARMIADAIEQGQPWLRFPWQLSSIMTAASLVPREIRAVFINKNAKG